jgi:hypothetical protein
MFGATVVPIRAVRGPRAPVRRPEATVPRRFRSWCVPLAAAAALLCAAPTGAAAAPADGVVDPAPIGPNQYFVGLVNDQSADATIAMACFGPVHAGQTGHPLADQTVKVLPVTAPTATARAGYTGAAGNVVGVGFGLSASAASPVVLRTWAVAAKIPTTLVLPCYGTGTVTFVPAPTSATARPATVRVTFVGQP